MSIQPRVSVIIPHYRDLDRLDLCLDALGRQSFPSGDFDIIVADNDSPEGEEAIAGVIAGRARLTVVRERGAGPARNGGVAICRGGILAFTDSDCLPEVDWLSKGVAALERSDLVGGRVTVLVDDLDCMTGAEAFERVFAFDIKAYVTRKNFAVTANLFCPRAVFEDVGPFRQGVSEDTEWCHRAISKGYRLNYAAQAVVGHPARRNWEELWRKWRRLNAESYALHRERKGGELRWLLRSLVLPLSALVHAPRVLVSDQLNTGDQRMAAIGTLCKLRLWRMVDALRLLGEKSGR